MSDSDRFLYGAQELKDSVKALVSDGKLHHAYLLEGGEGTGKKSFAKYTAYLLCGGEKAERNVVKRISEWACPDVRLITREEGKKNISINAVRDMIDDTPLTPTELDFKMYVYDHAECLSPQAQNALLKVIEEPPANVYIFLLCENSSQLLQTIRSRVQKLTMPLFSRNETKIFLHERFSIEELGSGREDIAINLSNGSLGYSIELLHDEKAHEFYDNANKIINIQAGKNRKNTYFDILNTVLKASTARENLEQLTDYLLLAYRDILNAKSSGRSAGAFFSDEDAEIFAENITMETVMDSINALKGLKFDASFNFNYSLAAASLAIMLWRAA